MADNLSISRRSWNMSKIRSKDTNPEQLVRSLMHRSGYRFTIDGPLNRVLPGKPDLVFPKYRIAVFVHGCFWHRHEGCKYAYLPKSRIDFWEAKFRKNIERDREVARLFDKVGWLQFVVWECQLKKDQLLIIENFRNLLTEGVQQSAKERRVS